MARRPKLPEQLSVTARWEGIPFEWMIKPARVQLQTLCWVAMGSPAPIRFFEDGFQTSTRPFNGMQLVLLSRILVLNGRFVVNRTCWVVRRQRFDRNYGFVKSPCLMATTNWMRFPWVLVSLWWLSRWWSSLLLISAESSENAYFLNTLQTVEELFNRVKLIKSWSCI